jgi:hypothetical protein
MESKTELSDILWSLIRWCGCKVRTENDVWYRQNIDTLHNNRSRGTGHNPHAPITQVRSLLFTDFNGFYYAYVVYMVQPCYIFFLYHT